RRQQQQPQEHPRAADEVRREERHEQAGARRDDRAYVNPSRQGKGSHRVGGPATTSRTWRRAAGAPQRMLSVRSRALVPQTMLSFSLPIDVAHTPALPQTTSSLSSDAGFQAIGSQVVVEVSAHCVPIATAVPSGAWSLPHITSARHALALTRSLPPARR